ncbi:MAG: hypothetical protein OXB88_07155 [Bacteriovoracales bacterium]|nr:hypothetical protein [Bacteriovoracales bacterium]
MAKFLLILIFILPVRIGVGSSFFAPDSDTALLIELATTTAAQLNELERLVTNAQKLTGSIQKYNEIVVDHWYRAQRIAFLVEDLSTLKSTKIKNLGELNRSLRNLKHGLTELEDLMVRYGVLRVQNQNISKALDKDDLKIIKEKMLAELQIKRAHKVTTVGNVQKVNAQINAYSNKHLVDLKNKANQQTKLLSIQNEIRALERERAAKKELLRREFYRMERTKKNQ